MSNDVFVGLDWAVHTHAVCVVDAAGTVLDRFEVHHDRDGLAELMRRLARWGCRLRIAIERPSVLIVDALVEAGHEVFSIHPNAIKAIIGRVAAPSSLDEVPAVLVLDCSHLQAPALDLVLYVVMTVATMPASPPRTCDCCRRRRSAAS